MKALGICLQKDYLRYAVIEGTKSTPTLIESKRLPTISPSNVPALMDWFDTQFRQIIAEAKPDRLAYKLSLEQRLEQQHYLSFPFGILNCIAKQQGITIHEFSQRGITPNKLSKPKGTDMHALVTSTFGAHPPYWDKYQQEAVLVAWFCL